MSDQDSCAKFETALSRDFGDTDETAKVCAELSALVLLWQSRANYWRGKAEGQAEMIRFLREIRGEPAERVVAEASETQGGTNG